MFYCNYGPQPILLYFRAKHPVAARYRKAQNSDKTGCICSSLYLEQNFFYSPFKQPSR